MQTAGRDRSRAQVLTGIAVAGLATVLSFHPTSAASGEFVLTLLIAAAAITAWMIGRWPTLGLCGLWAAIDCWTWPGERSAMLPGSLVVHAGVMIGLTLWISQLKIWLRTEHRLARIDSLTGLPN